MSTTKNTIYTGDAQVVLKDFATNSIDAIVTDPPYGISFIGLDWDRDVPGTGIWMEALRVLKPGGHLLAFAGSRTYHRMAGNIEKAGFEIRDQVMWIYASGFPRSHNIELAMRKKYGADMSKKWKGWGTTLKPAHEPIVIARKPFVGPVVDNVLAFGTGGINIERCRVVAQGDTNESQSRRNVVPFKNCSKGRFPANVIHSGISEHWASYFYCAKPSTQERDFGLEAFKLRSAQERTRNKGKSKTPHRGATGAARNFHPTVKPIALMEHLIRLVTPTGGTVLDPFAGSGTTLIAAQNLGHPYIGVEQDEKYVEIAEARLAA